LYYSFLLTTIRVYTEKQNNVKRYRTNRCDFLRFYLIQRGHFNAWCMTCDTRSHVLTRPSFDHPRRRTSYSTLLDCIMLKRNNSGAYLSRECALKDILSYRIKIFCAAGRSSRILMRIALAEAAQHYAKFIKTELQERLQCKQLSLSLSLPPLSLSLSLFLSSISLPSHIAPEVMDGVVFYPLNLSNFTYNHFSPACKLACIFWPYIEWFVAQRQVARKMRSLKSVGQ